MELRLFFFDKKEQKVSAQKFKLNIDKTAKALKVFFNN